MGRKCCFERKSTRGLILFKTTGTLGMGRGGGGGRTPKRGRPERAHLKYVKLLRNLKFSIAFIKVLFAGSDEKIVNTGTTSG